MLHILSTSDFAHAPETHQYKDNSGLMKGQFTVKANKPLT